jgi:hypothetical protein
MVKVMLMMADIIQEARERARAAQELLYEDRMNVIVYEQMKDPVTKITDLTETTILLGQPCRLHVSKAAPADQSESAAAVSQTITVHMAPELNILPGSQLVITHAGETVAYKSSGVVKRYETHQEIPLVVDQRWA